MWLEVKYERYQNDGITRHFNYDAIITGTSMAECFRTTEFGNLFNAKAVKVCYAGATFKEINDNLKVAYRSGHKIRYIVRALDPAHMFDEKGAMRVDLEPYPYYLYNDIVLDDVKYILNKDVWKVSLSMLAMKAYSSKEGVTSFDEYGNWSKKHKFGKEYLLNEQDPSNGACPFPHNFDSRLAERILDNFQQNVCALAGAHPETTFYYFISPYSCLYWRNYTEGQIESYMAAEKILLEQLLTCGNVKLFSFDLNTELTNNLDNYRDISHYGEWVNSLILHWMHKGQWMLNKDNYLEYLRKKEALLKSYSGQVQD